MSRSIFVMGVSGCGKSTIGQRLAEKLSVRFFDGDDYHPEVNIRKMESGQALDDADREPWLIEINKLAKREEAKGGCVIACSALKQTYRRTLEKNLQSVIWIFLEGSFELISDRLAKRQDHFMPASLLRSQFETLEIPESAIRVSIDDSIDELTTSIMKALISDG